MLAELDAIDAGKLSRENQIDAAILRNQIQSDIWGMDTLQAWAWDPQLYSGLAGGAIYNLMAREFAPLPERLKSAAARMNKLPSLFAQMRENIDPARVPQIHAETVAKQNGGVISLVEQFIVPNADQLQGEDRKRLDAAIEGLRKAVAEHQLWLDKTLVPNTKGDFRIGQKLYDEKLKVALMSSLSRAEIKQRGVAVAYCDSPGPLDKGLKTYYAISPIPDEWTDKQTDSFLREYNTRMIHLLSIHEAMPGHYLEGAFSARYPSTLRGVLRSGMFAEGWAVYTESVMMDAGYLDNDPLFHLVRHKFSLRAVANAILDQGVHVDNWSKEQAMELMVKRTFQQEREAEGKWVRAQLSSAQLPTYFVGVQEHFDLRKAMEQKQGKDFKLKAYHDQVLSYGAPPVRFVRAMMLDEPVK